jgi:hypothetical protein
MATKSYTVKSPSVVAYQANGSQRIQYSGEPFNTDGLRDGEVERLVEIEAIVAGEFLPEAPKASAVDAASDDGNPSGNASHEDWVAYAVSQGVDQDEAEALSRNELRDRFQ